MAGQPERGKARRHPGVQCYDHEYGYDYDHEHDHVHDYDRGHDYNHARTYGHAHVYAYVRTAHVDTHDDVTLTA